MSSLDPSVIASLLSAANQTKASTLASMCFLYYDYILTFPAEFKYIWKNKPLSFANALFIINRYIGLVGLTLTTIVLFTAGVTNDFCLNFFHAQAAYGFAAIILVEVILQMRVYAVWNCNKKILAFMLTIFSLEILAMILIVSFGAHKSSSLRHPNIPGFTGCFTTKPPTFYFTYWVPSVTFESCLCALMVYKTWQTYSGERLSPILKVLLRDSIIYFIGILSVLLTNAVLWLGVGGTMTTMAIGWGIAFPCAMGSRLLLNMREQYYEKTELSDLMTLSTFRQATTDEGRYIRDEGVSKMTTQFTATQGDQTNSEEEEEDQQGQTRRSHSSASH